MYYDCAAPCRRSEPPPRNRAPTSKRTSARPVGKSVGGGAARFNPRKAKHLHNAKPDFPPPPPPLLRPQQIPPHRPSSPTIRKDTYITTTQTPYHHHERHQHDLHPTTSTTPTTTTTTDNYYYFFFLFVLDRRFNRPFPPSPSTTIRSSTSTASTVKCAFSRYGEFATYDCRTS